MVCQASISTISCMAHRRPYLTGKKWARTRRRILDRDKWRCRACGKSGRLEVDHVIREADGGSRFDEANLACLCRNCHFSKTRQENRPPLSPDQADWLRFVGR